MKEVELVIRYVMSISELSIMATTNSTNITYPSACKVLEAAAWSLRLESKSTSECVRRKHSKINDLRDMRAMRGWVRGGDSPADGGCSEGSREKQPAGIGCLLSTSLFSQKCLAFPRLASFPFFQAFSYTRNYFDAPF